MVSGLVQALQGLHALRNRSWKDRVHEALKLERTYFPKNIRTWKHNPTSQCFQLKFPTTCLRQAACLELISDKHDCLQVVKIHWKLEKLVENSSSKAISNSSISPTTME